MRVCIIGAGPAGLSAARALKRVGIEYDHFERHGDVGGIWDMDNPGTPVYESAHFISSRQTSGFFDFPMPETFPDYPGNREILSYTRHFAEVFGLNSGIRFNTPVTRVEKKESGWRVERNAGEASTYDAVICATGTTWHPRMPRHPGRFDGEIRHSNTYRSLDEFRGRRVLIVGLGNSGADIACDAAKAAEQAWVSVRRGYHVIPKHVFGIPSDLFSSRGPKLPLAIERPVFGAILRLLLGDVTRLGMPRPDHRLFESHPLLNDQLLHHLRHGDLTIKADVERFDGPEVTFTDGSREAVDLVLYATGYDWRLPYLPEEYFHWSGGRPQLYLTAFNPLAHNLFGASYIEVNSSAYALFDQVTHLIAHYLHDQVHHPNRAARFDAMIAHDEPDLSGGIRLIATDRHQSYVDEHAFKRYLTKVRKRMGWPGLTPGMFDALRSPDGDSMRLDGHSR